MMKKLNRNECYPAKMWYMRLGMVYILAQHFQHRTILVHIARLTKSKHRRSEALRWRYHTKEVAMDDIIEDSSCGDFCTGGIAMLIAEKTRI